MQFLKPLQHTLLSITLAVILSVLGGWFIFGGGTTETQTVSAGSTDNLSGWAWSSNIGWVSFNCTNTGENCGTSNYGVHINESQRFTSGTGDFSGSAWSSTGPDSNGNPTGIGWISFDQTKTGTTTSPLAYIDWGTGRVYGWARALSGCQDVLGVPVSVCSSNSPGLASGGWDGWIKLSGVATNGSTYGVQLVGNDLTGYAWGGDVVGWIRFSGTATDGSSYGVKFNPIGTPPPAGCGTANSVPAAGIPATNLCSDGSLPPVTNNNVTAPYSWSWTCDNAGSPVSCSAPYTQCSDGIDNDGDGQTDNLDSGCIGSSGYNASDNTERNFQFREF